MINTFCNTSNALYHIHFLWYIELSWLKLRWPDKSEFERMHETSTPLPYLPAWGLFLWDQDVDHIMTKRLCLTWACPADLEYSTDGLDITKKWLNWAIHSFDVSLVVLIFWFKLEGCRFGSGLWLYQGFPQYLNLRMMMVVEVSLHWPISFVV